MILKEFIKFKISVASNRMKKDFQIRKFSFTSLLNVEKNVSCKFFQLTNQITEIFNYTKYLIFSTDSHFTGILRMLCLKILVRISEMVRHQNIVKNIQKRNYNLHVISKLNELFPIFTQTSTVFTSIFDS